MEIESILGQLANIHPSLCKDIWGSCKPYECICGSIAGKIIAWLKKNYPEQADQFIYCDGTYIGLGSRATYGTGHCWAEIKLNEGKIIIDGAYAQFFPDDTPPEVKDRVRLAIFHPNDERQKWYELR